MSRSFTREETRRLASILADTAQAEVMPRFRNLPRAPCAARPPCATWSPMPTRAAERMISARLAKLYPGAVLIGEEASTRNALLNMLVDADLAFLIDPIDGTRNYVAGLPLFGMMIAACHRGDVIAGVIYDPSAATALLAVRHEGAWMEYENGKQAPLAVASPAPPEDMDGLISTGALPEPLRSTGQRQSFEIGQHGLAARAAMNTACWRRAIAMSRCTTSSPPGTTPRAGCCTAKPAAMPRASTVRRTSPRTAAAACCTRPTRAAGMPRRKR